MIDLATKPETDWLSGPLRTAGIDYEINQLEIKILVSVSINMLVLQITKQQIRQFVAAKLAEQHLDLHRCVGHISRNKELLELTFYLPMSLEWQHNLHPRR